MHVCACITGVIVGVILRYGVSGTEPEVFHLAEERSNCSVSNHTSEGLFEVGQNIQINTKGDNFLCSVSGKVFSDSEGNAIRSRVRQGGC